MIFLSYTIDPCDGKGGLLVKIVFASTPDQEKEINEKVRYIYSNVFPLFFSDKEMKEFERLKILYISNDQFKDFSTLKDAFQVMTSLQTIISVLESVPLYDYYSALFNKNVDTLQKLGLFFPLEFEQFVEAKNIKKCSCSIYTKPANELLI